MPIFRMNCKICNNPFEPIRGLNGIAKSKYCPQCLYEANILRRKAKLSHSAVFGNGEIKQPKKGLKQKVGKVRKSRNTDYSEKSVKSLLAILKTHFNLYIRNRDRLPGNTFFCPTCQTHKAISGDNYQACHCFPSTYSALRFHELNVWGGCKACNYFRHGAGHEYNDWLRNKIGESEYNKLLLLKNQRVKWNKFELIALINKYKMLNLQEGNQF